MSEDVEMELELLEAAYGPDFALLRENSCEVKASRKHPTSLTDRGWQSVAQIDYSGESYT